MNRHLVSFSFAMTIMVCCLFSPGRANAQEDSYRMPHSYLGIDFSGASRNIVAFTFQQAFPVNPNTAITGRFGVFGFGSTNPTLLPDGTAQLDLLGGIGLLTSTENQHNLELEGTYNRFTQWASSGVNRFQNRVSLTAGYRLQPSRNGKGFSLRTGAGMMFYQDYDTGSATSNGEPNLDNTAVYPTGYFGMGYAF
jgi:hypothetical protein